MSDEDWDDWENAEIIIPTINILNKEQLKRIEERKLIEEADTELAKELFSDEVTSQQKNSVKNEIVKKPEEDITKTKENREAKIKKLKNQMDNELKQKENSKKIREAKLKKQREIELYGEPEKIYEYDDYDSLFYK
jgi:hypothetical protein